MNDRFDDIMSRLSAQQPVLDNPDAMADMVMARIQEERPVSRRRLLLRVVHATSTVAASMLILLYVWQMFDVAEPVRQQSVAVQTPVIESNRYFRFSQCRSLQEVASEMRRIKKNNQLLRKYYEM